MPMPLWVMWPTRLVPWKCLLLTVMEVRRTSSWNLSHLTVSWPGVMELFVECTIVVQPESKFSTFTKDLHRCQFRNGLKEVRGCLVDGFARPNKIALQHRG